MGVDWDKLKGKGVKLEDVDELKLLEGAVESIEVIIEEKEIIKPEPVLKERKKRVFGKVQWEEPTITKLMTAHELIFGVSYREKKGKILDKIKRDIPKLKELMKKQKN